MPCFAVLQCSYHRQYKEVPPTPFQNLQFFVLSTVGLRFIDTGALVGTSNLHLYHLALT